METKLFEIRDSATFIPVLAIRLHSTTEQESYLLSRAGYGLYPGYQGRYVILTRIVGDWLEAHSDPNEWPKGHTLSSAHRYITDLWEELASGDVVDVEFIKGETSAPKVSERLE